MTSLSRPGLCIVNTHPVANKDGDWSRANRFYPLHQAQLAAPLVLTVANVALL